MTTIHTTQIQLTKISVIVIFIAVQSETQTAS